MSFKETIAFQAFWSQSWSAPLRASCRWLQQQPGPVVPRLPDALAPGWLRPLCFQRQVARAVERRLAWSQAHPDAPLYGHEASSSPDWDQDAWTPYHPRWLRGSSDARLLPLMQLELERLLRIMEKPPSVPGEAVWTHAALGSCERLAQLYQEVLRRCGRWSTRYFVRRLLWQYGSGVPVVEVPEEPEDDAPAAPPAKGQPEDSPRWQRFERWRRAWLASRDAAPPVPETPAR